MAARAMVIRSAVANPAKRTDFMNDPEVIAKRQKALARMEAAE